MPTTRPLGLAHLTCLHVSPPDLVSAAAVAGFAAVGLRAAPVHPAEVPWPLTPGSPMLREVQQRLDDTGLRVWDLEVARLGPGDTGDGFEALFDVGAELGARFVNVFPAEPDRDRLAVALHRLAEHASSRGLRPLLEPMRYNATPDLDAALDVLVRAEHPALALVIDTLHFCRFNGDPSRLAQVDPALLVSLQLADGPSGLPSVGDHPVGVRLPRNQSLDAPPLALEGRAFRLLPGEGQLPLAAIAAAMPADCAVAVEAPCWALQQDLPLDRYLARAMSGARRVLDQQADR